MRYLASVTLALAVVPAAFLAWASPAMAQGTRDAMEQTMDKSLHGRARRSVDAGLHYLRGEQAENGSWSMWAKPSWAS